MEIHEFDKIRHSSAIHTVALSHDERLIACGGWAPAPITVWNLSNGERLTEISGFAGQLQSIAFSPDASKIAAANVWGGLWVWNLSDGALAHQKEATNSRRIPSLVFPSTARNHETPVAILDSIHRGPVRKLSPDGKLLATNLGGIVVTKYKTKIELQRLDFAKYEVAKTGVRYLSWSSDSTRLALTGDGWAGCWAPAEDTFYACSLPPGEWVSDVAVFSSTQRILCATGKPALLVMDLPAEPLLTDWQQRYRRLIAEPSSEEERKSRNDWNWNVTSWGYEGARLQAGELLWYSHRHNTMDGGSAANIQTLANFLADGPADNTIPEEVLGRLCRAVNLETTTREARKIR